jgi:2-methylaconitate cis-trans-isomerase PrpF
VLLCGTSRAVFFLDKELPDDERRERLLLRLMIGGEGGGGLGSDHYQGNKVAVLSTAANPDTFHFRFYQVDRSKRQLLSELECSNVAAGAGLFALLQGLAVPGDRGVLYALNTGTDQLIELEPPSQSPVWQGEWTVRFLHGHSFSVNSFDREPLTLAYGGGRRVHFWVVVRGNVFVFANFAPAEAEPSLVEELGRQGSAAALSMGAEESRARTPKVILYEIIHFTRGDAWINAACFFQGQVHRSLPGSGAMCLSAFLALTMREVGGWSSIPIENSFYFAHHSGTLGVRVYCGESPAGRCVIATEFSTRVRLLLLGHALMPVEALEV